MTEPTTKPLPPGHAEWLARRERRRQERQAQARRRAYGLVQRHATKLARKGTP